MKEDLVIDIETVIHPVRQSDLDKAMLAYEPPKNYKEADAILRHRTKYEEELLDKLCSDRRFSLGGKKMISCALGRISHDSVPGVTEIQSFASDDLAVITNGIVGYLNQFREYRLIGWNHEGFDLPEIAKAFYLTRVRPKFRPAKWDIIDLKHKFKGCTAIMPNKKFVGLKEAAQAFGLEIPDVDGSNVAELHANGDWEKIKSYNEHDVEITGQVYLGLTSVFTF